MSNHIHAISIDVSDDIEASVSAVDSDTVIDFTLKISDGTGDPNRPEMVLDPSIHEVVLMWQADDLPRMHHLFSDLADGLHQAMEELRPVLAIKLLGRKDAKRDGKQDGKRDGKGAA